MSVKFMKRDIMDRGRVIQRQMQAKVDRHMRDNYRAEKIQVQTKTERQRLKPAERQIEKVIS